MEPYRELLDATIAHLEELKRRGTRYLEISPDALAALSEPATAPSGRRSATATPFPSRVAQNLPRRPKPAPAPAPLPAETPQASPVVAAPASNKIIPTTPGAQDKASAMHDLRERALVCQKCANLASSRKNVVFGVGNIDAELMFVGEAPGADEDEQSEPFVGRAGQLLTKIIQTMGMQRDQVYIANILKCRPDTPGQSYGNRPPSPEEMERCLPYLHAQIDLIKPRVLVALGATAVDGLFGKVPGVGITKLRGRWREYRGIPVMPTYHPSYLLRPNVQNVKRECWEDMLQVMERLAWPISEKQRGYFLKSAG